jgi:hypothetical protein
MGLAAGTAASLIFNPGSCSGDSSLQWSPVSADLTDNPQVTFATVDQKELANSAFRFLAANYRLERKRPQGSPEMAVAPEAASEITGAASGHSPPLS